MRVLMISDVYFPRINGVSTAIQTYRQQLDAQGIDSILIAPRYDGDTAGKAEGGPEDPRVKRLRSWSVPLDREDRFVPPGDFKRAAMEAARTCDLIHIQTPFSAHMAGVAVARATGRPVVSSYHTLFEEYLHHYAPGIPAGWLRGLARMISRKQCNALDAIIVPSSPMAERLHAYGIARPMHVLPTGIPLSRFGSGDRARFRAHYQIDEDRPVALFVGRAAHEKNIDFLIDALRHALRDCPRLLLLIAGEGPALEHLRDRVHAEQLVDSVRFVGYLDRATELPDCYAAADVFVFASRTETQGLVLLEAMAAGLPVVALAEMGTCDILTPASGAVVPADDVQAFAAALSRVASSPELRARMREQGLAWAAEWSDVALTAKLTALYRSLLSHSTATENSWKAPSKARPV
ncbi:glycosyltransferase [Uliginosibacterium sp. H3]|uniref:Glycosyltransferase n=1 Tax=Uliginosibacterium silvisoli TaxID=3114758 RepID=A0ABU6K363_9RHOO|nr:glycosyltransferase [Uliginosibacterium sp. H3]